MVSECGAGSLGFPLRLGGGREDLSEKAARAIIDSLRPPLHGIVITYLDRAEEIQALCRDVNAPAVQLQGDLALEELAALGRCAGDLFVIKSLIVRRESFSDLLADVEKMSPFVDAFLTDTFDPATGRSGATGKTHDWSVSRRLVELSPLPVILAGGLTPGNVSEAIRVVRPAGVDSHTGVEDESGRKDRRLVEMFISEAMDSFASL